MYSHHRGRKGTTFYVMYAGSWAKPETTKEMTSASPPRHPRYLTKSSKWAPNLSHRDATRSKSRCRWAPKERSCKFRAKLLLVQTPTESKPCHLTSWRKPPSKLNHSQRHPRSEAERGYQGTISITCTRIPSKMNTNRSQTMMTTTTGQTTRDPRSHIWNKRITKYLATKIYTEIRSIRTSQTLRRCLLMTFLTSTTSASSKILIIWTSSII